jgi:carbamoyl-phosphate synthase large subunit
VKDADKTPLIVSAARQLTGFGFSVVSTDGTARFLREHGIEAAAVLRVSEGRPNILDRIRDGKIQLIINTPSGKVPRQDEVVIRSTAVSFGVPVVTTLPGADAYVRAIRALLAGELGVKPIQEYLRRR